MKCFILFYFFYEVLLCKSHKNKPVKETPEDTADDDMMPATRHRQGAQGAHVTLHPICGSGAFSKAATEISQKLF